MIALVVAAARNGAIGKENKLLWHLPNDLRFFKNLTWGSVVIMGRKTFESVNKPLPGRLNIVVTRNQSWTHEGVVVCNSLDEAVQAARQADYKTVFVIGGADIYRQSMSIADVIYLTSVHADLEGDVFFPNPDPMQWELVQTDHQLADEKNKWAHCFERWERIKQ
ncbi:MAG: dihydrofolate reductase [Ferruginibacter sp.]